MTQEAGRSSGVSGSGRFFVLLYRTTTHMLQTGFNTSVTFICWSLEKAAMNRYGVFLLTNT